MQQITTVLKTIITDDWLHLPVMIERRTAREAPAMFDAAAAPLLSLRFLESLV